jgi:hypothetical protein
MNIPIPPTDNIYKYAAIVGTIIVIFSLYVPYLILKDIREKKSTVFLKMETIKAEQDFFERKISDLENFTDNSILWHKGKFRLDTSKLYIPYTWDEIKKMKEQIRELFKSEKINVAELQVLDNDFNQLSSDFELIKNISDRLFYFGIVLALVGYILWYYRIQRYQDKALRNSVQK